MSSRQILEPGTPTENPRAPSEQQESGVRVPRSASSHGIDSTRHGPHRWGMWLVIVLVFGGAAWYFHGVAQQQNEKTNFDAHKAEFGQAAPVVVATARKGNLPIYFTGLGTVTAYYTVTIHTRVDGQIMDVLFKEGQFVNKGDALVEIDPRPYQVMLEQAEGQFAKDQATLKDAELDFNRYTTLVKEGVVSKQQLDTQTATYDAAKGALKTDQAAIDTAKLDLTYCHITAPITGRIGLRLVDPGNIVHATDTTGLVVITQLQPIAVIFTLPQDQLPEVYKELRAQEKLPVDAYDRDNATRITTGYLQTMDNQIDTTTGTYKLKAVFDNKNNELFPNQFVNIHLLVNTQRGVTIVPAAAVQRGPDGTYVYVVKGGNTVKVRSVKVGLTQGNNISIASGVQPGEQVVTDGLDKLTDGTTIEARVAPNDGGDGGSENARDVQDASQDAGRDAGTTPLGASAAPAASQTTSAATGANAAAASTPAAGHETSKSGDSTKGGNQP